MQQKCDVHVCVCGEEEGDRKTDKEQKDRETERGNISRDNARNFLKLTSGTDLPTNNCYPKKDKYDHV